MGITEESSAAGAIELNLIQGLASGNFGHFLAIIVVLIGVYAFAMGKVKEGLTLICLAVVITMLPSFYNAVRLVVCPLAIALGASSSSCTI